MVGMWHGLGHPFMRWPVTPQGSGKQAGSSAAPSWPGRTPSLGPSCPCISLSRHRTPGRLMVGPAQHRPGSQLGWLRNR